MPSPPVPYAAYHGHRRGQSASSALVGPDAGSSSSSGGGGNSSASVSRVPVQHAVVNPPPAAPSSHPPPPALRAMGSGSGPPPLRTAASLRAASSAAAVAQGKGPSSAISPATSPSQNPARRMVSSSLAVPNSAHNSAPGGTSTSNQGASHPPPSPKANGHAKRHSYSPITLSQAPQHSRSASGSAVPPNLPHHISTAQKLRSVNTSGTPTGSSSNASSPTGTPRGVSPSWESMNGFSNLPGQGTSQLGLDPHSIGRRTTYRPGFQPKGSYRVRTDEFIAARERKRSGKSAPSSSTTGETSRARTDLESQRLERRLEKLLVLHYESTPVSLDSMPSWMPNTLRKTRLMAEEERRIREEEMRIVKWEEDSSRKICPLCSTKFSLSVRKHHCRLCGRIVCASPHLTIPPTFEPSTTPVEARLDDTKCSSLMIAGGKGGPIIKDMPRWDDHEAFREGLDSNRGIRMCKDCRETIVHRQWMLDDGSVPVYLQLYEALVALQKEIEQSLPEFQEMVMGLQKQDSAAALGTVEETGEDILSPSRSDVSTTLSIAAMKAKNKNSLALQRDAAHARKQLLANFANYDLVAKRIRNLEDGGNTSLGRIKVAIWTKANLFLQQNMFPLQSLPKLATRKEGKKASERPEAKANGRTGDVGDPQAAKENLAVLEQQLALVRKYAASAAQARKFQDAQSLKDSAQELEAEIAQVRKTVTAL